MFSDVVDNAINSIFLNHRIPAARSTIDLIKSHILWYQIILYTILVFVCTHTTWESTSLP